jgi:hypothetical protein
MGAVHKGRDASLGREVAVKVLLEAHQEKPDLVRRFVEEAQIGGQLQHPGVVPVYELGQFPDPRPYFTMKLVKGRTLAQLLAERTDPAQDRPRFLKVFEQVCQALAYAHARGVIHRDLKPSNVMVGCSIASPARGRRERPGIIATRGWAFRGARRLQGKKDTVESSDARLRREAADSFEPPPAISVIIPTLNEETALASTLSALARMREAVEMMALMTPVSGLV